MLLMVVMVINDDDIIFQSNGKLCDYVFLNIKGLYVVEFQSSRVGYTPLKFHTDFEPT